MTPKDKAEELWSKFFHKQIDITGDGDGELAYQCALITVEEVLNNIEVPSDEYKYFEQVKQEIEKL